MTRWTPEEDAQLTELAAEGLSPAEVAGVMKTRSESAVAGRASKIGASFRSREHQPLREYLSRGGAVVREDIGGVIGVRWAKATRSGEAFSARACEVFVRLGLLAPTERPDVFAWKPAA